MSHASSTPANRRGILCITVAMVCFVLNDMLMKKLGESLPLPQVVFLRGAFAAGLLLAAASAAGLARQLPRVAERRVVLRALFDAVGSLLYLASLMHLPLANATAINMAAPLIIAALAVFLLGERPGRGRWLAIGGGFLGVLLIVQPAADSFSGWAWVCLAGTLGHAGRDLLTRRIGASVPALLVTFASAVAVSVAGGLWMGLSGWAPVSWRQAGLVSIAATLLASAYWLMVLGLRSGEMSVVAPFRYVGLLAALALGWLVWRDVPNTVAMGGIALLIAAGVVVLHEQRSAGWRGGTPPGI